MTTSERPTQFPELNDLLAELVSRTAGILDRSFVGAYLQGSFAVGDADTYSDCDFLIPVSSAITPEQEAALRELHYEIPTRSGHWTHHLEGSYPPVDELRSLAGLGKEWLYIDHGWREMQWSTHCNTEVVRWSLRERGVTLSGPHPRLLVDEVPAPALRARMLVAVETFLPELMTWISFDIAWAQRHAVTTLCRILYTLETATVASKKASLVWASERLDRRWTPLIAQVLEDRDLGWAPGESPRPGSVASTLAFAEYAKSYALAHAAG